MNAPATTVDELLSRYEVFFLDAYGVLVRSAGALPGAAEFLRRLEEAGKGWLLLSNDASRSPRTAFERYRRFGLTIPEERILTSGLLLREHYAAEALAGARTIVLGTEDSNEYVRAAGGEIVAADDASAEVVVVADDDGYPFLDRVNDVVTVLLRRLDRGERTRLLLPNPDLVFPNGEGSFGVTAGAVAAMLEAVLTLRDPERTHRFVALGKPHAPMFQAAVRRFPAVDRRKIVMVGDQLVTDILGASRFGIDSVLVETGISRMTDLATSAVQPTYTLSSVNPGGARG